MHPHLSRAVAALAMLITSSALAVALPAIAHADPAPDVRITEWMYNPVGSSGEYIEITNLGASSVSLADWSFDDDSEKPGTVSLAGLGTLTAGESAIITESSDATFRSEWGLGPTVKILSGNTTNLGRADEINIFDGSDPVANLVDRLAYDDQGTGATKGPRTQGVSGIPKTAAALGADDASQWQLSAVGDAEGSWASTGGDVGSPGTSRFGNGIDPRGGDTGGGPTLPCRPEAPDPAGALPATALTPSPWPGSAEVTLADAPCAWVTSTGPEGRDVSGLVFDPSNPAVL